MTTGYSHNSEQPATASTESLPEFGHPPLGMSGEAASENPMYLNSHRLAVLRLVHDLATGLRMQTVSFTFFSGDGHARRTDEHPD